MAEETKVAINKWRELIGQITDTYITAKKAAYTESNSDDYLIVEGISK